MPARTAPARPAAALDGQALRVALLEGVRFFGLAGNAVPGGAAELVEHQLAAIRRAMSGAHAPRVCGYSAESVAPVVADDAQAALPWWRRD